MKKFKIIFLTSLLAIIMSGCSISFGTSSSSGTTSAADGGVYKSINKGTSWGQKGLILTTGARQSFASLDINYLTLDPQDNKAIYAGSVENGLYYSYDGGEGWQIAKSLGKVTVTNIAVDPVNKCIIYATAGNRVFKSADCSRNWSVIYFDNDLKVAITSLVIDSSNNNNVYIGTTRGEIIKSSDRGGNWKTLNRFSGQVNKIVMDPVNTKNIFVANAGKIFRSVDAGINWVSLEDKLKSVSGSKVFRDLIMIKADKPTLFLANSYGLAKSTDGGENWSKLELITPKTAATINAVNANPQDANEIYYVTNTTFYRSLDGGKNWSSMKLPTNRAGWKLLIDPKNPSVVYLSTKLLNKR